MRHTLQETTTDLDRANGQRVIHICAEDSSTAVVCTFEFQENNALFDEPVLLSPASEPLGNAALSDQLLSLVSCLRDSHYRRDLRL